MWLVSHRCPCARDHVMCFALQASLWLAMSVAIPTSYRRATFALTSTASTLSKVLPTFAFIEPTPVKTQTGNGSKPTPSSQSHRLLYQGSLLISDQHATIPLEGMFTASRENNSNRLGCQAFVSSRTSHLRLPLRFSPHRCL